jgi:hypothetical protein
VVAQRDRMDGQGAGITKAIASLKLDTRSSTASDRSRPGAFGFNRLQARLPRRRRCVIYCVTCRT